MDATDERVGETGETGCDAALSTPPRFTVAILADGEGAWPSGPLHAATDTINAATAITAAMARFQLLFDAT